jgi:hypothetical protein
MIRVRLLSDSCPIVCQTYSPAPPRESDSDCARRADLRAACGAFKRAPPLPLFRVTVGLAEITVLGSSHTLKELNLMNDLHAPIATLMVFQHTPEMAAKFHGTL